MSEKYKLKNICVSLTSKITVLVLFLFFRCMVDILLSGFLVSCLEFAVINVLCFYPLPRYESQTDRLIFLLHSEALVIIFSCMEIKKKISLSKSSRG